MHRKKGKSKLEAACKDNRCQFIDKFLYRTLQEIGSKQRIMELMTHSDQEVRYQALMAVQKYMHQTW
jgi:tRNA isopentenyl-2-thiomethyl-A-37 hydroxylase MiaE